jgi:amidase
MPAFSPFASVLDLAAQIRERSISSVEMLELYRARIERYNPAINAVIYADWDRALQTARARDVALAKGTSVGPLHGVPITVKEAFDVAGMPSTWGVPELADNIPQRNSVPVDRLLAAGAVLMGKTNVPRLVADHQTFNAVYGRTNNPWDLDRTPSGSSGGAAAALAAGLTGLEIGSDIGGSIRQPSHCCGIYGHKPTFGICSLRGHDWPGDLVSLDMGVVGPMARSARDLDLGLSVLAGPDPADAGAWHVTLPDAPHARVKGLRIGVLFDDAAAPVDREVQAALQRLSDVLEQQGAKLTRHVRPIQDSVAASDLYIQLLRSATSAHLSDDEVQHSLNELKSLPSDESGYVADTARGRTLSHRTWLRLNEQRHQLKLEWERFFGDYDLLLCPAACRAASPHDEATPRHERTAIISGELRPATNDLFWAGLTGMVFLPSTVAPIGMTSDRLPIGAQIVGPWYKDRSTIAFARWLEQEYYGFTAPPNYA